MTVSFREFQLVSAQPPVMSTRTVPKADVVTVEFGAPKS
jgi:hypothetical protein